MPRATLDNPGPGRPEIGGAVHVKVGDERLVRLDNWAATHGITRAEAIRHAVDQLLKED